MLNGVAPWAYFSDVLEELASGWMPSRLEELQPASETPTAPSSSDSHQPGVIKTRWFLNDVVSHPHQPDAS